MPRIAHYKALNEWLFGALTGNRRTRAYNPCINPIAQEKNFAI
jgi:hypothetical protein